MSTLVHIDLGASTHGTRIVATAAVVVVVVVVIVIVVVELLIASTFE